MVLLAHILDPFIVTPTPTGQAVFKDAAGGSKVYAYWVGFLVRDMGTATWVRIGKQGNHVDTLIGINAYSEYDVPAGFVFDAGELHIASDTSDAIIEITGMRLGRGA